jgi:hypothetical protein
VEQESECTFNRRYISTENKAQLIFLHDSYCPLAAPSCRAFFDGCAGQNRLVATPDKCIRVHQLPLTRQTRAVVNATLRLQVDTRRRACEAHDFCAFQQPTSNGRYALLMIYDQVGNHTSPTWLLLSRTGVIDTQLSSSQLRQDSLRSVEKRILGLTRLPVLDEGCRQELLQHQLQDARTYCTQAIDSQ